MTPSSFGNTHDIVSLWRHTWLDIIWARKVVGSIKLYVSFAEYHLSYRGHLQKRPIILSILLTETTPYLVATWPIAISIYIYLSTSIYLHLSIYIYPSTYIYLHLSMYLHLIYLSTCHLSIYMCPSTSIYLHLSIYIYLSSRLTTTMTWHQLLLWQDINYYYDMTSTHHITIDRCR